ncbi:MAG: hypothetical protein IJD70_09085 [Clostridia bacterium]|nr:hypothetical protein [Clostridia bacterium]
MKRFISALLTIAMVAALAIGVGAEKEAYTPDANAVAITDQAGFLAMDPAGSYYLANDLTLTATYSGDFAGTFDGNGKTITLSAPVFATVNGATIKNLNVKGAITTAEKTAFVNENDHDFIAAVAVITSGNSVFTNITSDVDISATGGNTRGAGIVAFTNAEGTVTMTDCVNYGDVFMHYSGGIYGWTDKAVNATFTNCVNYGNISSTTGYVGGVVNRVSAKAATNVFVGCENHGEVSGTTQVAGIVAYASGNLSFDGCLNTGKIINVEGKNTHAAGIIGTNQANAGTTTFIKNCVNTGDITGYSVDGEHTAGGIAGYINETTLIMEYCYNSGDITGTFAVAGLAGRVRHKAAGTVEPNTQAAFRYCINTGNITAERSAAGISARCGLTNGLGTVEFTNCINTGNISVVNLRDAQATNNDCGIAGIAGHVRAKESEGSKVVVTNCITTGDITVAAGTTRIPAFLVGFAGGGANIEFNNNKVSGKLINEDDATKVAGLFNNNSYYLPDGALNTTAVTADYSYPASREKLDGAEAADYVQPGTKYTLASFDTAVLTSGEAIYEINQAYKAATGSEEDVFFMTIDGTFKPTTVATGENSVLKIDGGYANKLPEVPESTEPAPDTTEPAPDTTEPGSSSETGDSSIVFIALVVISVSTLAVVSKKRKN